MVREALLEVFYNFTFPCFARFSWLSEIDSELKTTPFGDTARSWRRLRPLHHGVIVAPLVGRRNDEHLVEICTHRMRITIKGFDLKRFQTLVDPLAALAA